MSIARRLPPSLVVLSVLAGSCSAPLPLDDAQIGVVEDVGTMTPGFVIEASPVIVDGRPRVEVRAAITPADLIFTREDRGFVAEIPMWFRTRDRQGRETFDAREVVDSLVVATIAETRSDRPLVLAETLAAPPGRLVAEVILRDARGEPRATRRFEVAMPEPEVHPIILPPGLLRGDEFIVGARVPQWRLRDQVRTTVEVHSADDAAAAVVSLVRVPVDTAVANPPFWINPGRGSLSYRGARFDGEGLDTLMVFGAVDQGAELPLLDQGAYLITAWIPGLEDSGRARPLIVLPADHPRVETVDALIDALTYIAYPAELEQMRAAPGAFQRREAFDAFWGSLFESRQLAEQTMRLYYERVEEANRLFTSHKPGWMTDRGMIYIVHGAPAVVERGIDGEVWRYAGTRGAATEAYFFERVTYDGSPWPLDHHVLQRSARFEDAWQQGVRRWRRGDAR